MKKPIAALLFLAGLNPVWAQGELKIHCRPGGAQVFLQRPGFQDKALGPAEQTLPLPAGALVGGKLRLRLSLSGYQERSLEIAAPLPAEFPAPAEPPLELTPLPGAAIPWLPLLGLLALAAGGGWALGRRQAPPHVAHKKSEFPEDAVRIGDYRLGQPLGQGATATVFRAGKPGGEVVALKLLDAQLSFSPEYRKRLQREVAIYQNLNHPNLVRLLDHGEHKEMLYLVYELLEGQSLSQRLAQGPVEWRQAVDWTIQALQGVHALHSQGVAHRDLKPDNLFLCGNLLKIVDLGVARGQAMTAATATGMVLGTPRYMAPEQVQGELTLETDQYALGTVLYQMLAGHTPFEGDDDMAQAFARLEREAPPLECQGFPEELGAHVTRLLQRQPEQRFPTAQEAAQALRAVIAAP